MVLFWTVFGRFVSYLSYLFFVLVVSLLSVVSFRLFRWFCFACFGGFVSFVSVPVSFRSFRFVVSDFSTCQWNHRWNFTLVSQFLWFLKLFSRDSRGSCHWCHFSLVFIPYAFAKCKRSFKHTSNNSADTRSFPRKTKITRSLQAEFRLISGCYCAKKFNSMVFFAGVSLRKSCAI